MPLHLHARLTWAICVASFALAVCAIVPAVGATRRALIAERESHLELCAALLSAGGSDRRVLAEKLAARDPALQIQPIGLRRDAVQQLERAAAGAPLRVADASFRGYAFALPAPAPERALVIGYSLADLNRTTRRNLLLTIASLAGGIAVIGSVALVLQQRLGRSFSEPVRALVRAHHALAERHIALKANVRRREGEMDRQMQVLRKAQENLMQTERLAAIGKLAAGVAHEINNPLASIASYAEDAIGQLRELRAIPAPGEGAPLPLAGGSGTSLCLADVPGGSLAIRDAVGASVRIPDALGASLRIIEEQAYRCKQITDKLLTFARETELQLEWVSLDDLLAGAVMLESFRARKAGVKITLGRLDRGRIRTDPHHLEQVLVNLIDNAVDAAAGQGEVEVSGDVDDRVARIAVSDRGPGIPAPIRSLIFDPFFTTKPIGAGTGMGLTICYGIVTKLKGRIWFDTIEGQGTTFRVELPVDPLRTETGAPADGWGVEAEHAGQAAARR